MNETILGIATIIDMVILFFSCVELHFNPGNVLAKVLAVSCFAFFVIGMFIRKKVFKCI